ncbi:MAG: flagellar FliJ family protein [Rhizomicrobium sp.]
MKRRDSLLRLKKFRVDEFKRRMGTLDAMIADAEKKIHDLDESVVRERQRAGESEIGRAAFPSFLRSIDSRRENLKATLSELERERAAVQLELTGAFQDMKSLELAMEQQLKKLADAEAHRTQVEFDEVALVRHLRRQALR